MFTQDRSRAQNKLVNMIHYVSLKSFLRFISQLTLSSSFIPSLNQMSLILNHQSTLRAIMLLLRHNKATVLLTYYSNLLFVVVSFIFILTTARFVWDLRILARIREIMYVCLDVYWRSVLELSRLIVRVRKTQVLVILHHGMG